MNFRKLLAKYTDLMICKRLVKLYPDSKKSMGGYVVVLDTLRNKRPRKNDMKILVETVTNDDEDEDWEDYVSVGGSKNGEDIWAIELDTWSNWLGMEIDERSLLNFCELDIICHCLWEMTFFGYNEQAIYRTGKSLKNRVKDLEKELKDKNDN